MLTIRNIVATFNLGHSFSPLHYSMLAHRGMNTEYHPVRFHSVIMRLRTNDRRTISAMLFRNGKCVVCGARSMNELNKYIRRITKRIRHATQVKTFKSIDIRVRNIAGSMALNQRLNIEKLYEDIVIEGKLENIRFKRNKSILDFTKFPALRTKIIVPESNNILSLLIFINGKIIITGSKDIDTLYNCSTSIKNLLLSCYKRKIKAL